MAQTGYNTNTPNKIAKGDGVVYTAFNTSTGSGTKIGVVRGGVRFNANPEVRNVPYDGKLTNVKGLDRIVMRTPTLAFTMLEATQGNLATLMEPGGATPSTFTDSGLFFDSGDYVTGLAVMWLRADGTRFGYYFANALCTQFEAQGGGSDAEVEFAVTFEARLAHGATPDEGDVSYTLFELAAA